MPTSLIILGPAMESVGCSGPWFTNLMFHHSVASLTSEVFKDVVAKKLSCLGHLHCANTEKYIIFIYLYISIVYMPIDHL